MTITEIHTAAVLDELAATTECEHGYLLGLLVDETNSILARRVLAALRPSHPEYVATLRRLTRFQPILDQVERALAGTGIQLEWHTGRTHLLSIIDEDGTTVRTWPTVDPDTSELLTPERSATLAGAALLSVLVGQ